MAGNKVLSDMGPDDNYVDPNKRPHHNVDRFREWQKDHAADLKDSWNDLDEKLEALRKIDHTKVTDIRSGGIPAGIDDLVPGLSDAIHRKNTLLTIDGFQDNLLAHLENMDTIGVDISDSYFDELAIKVGNLDSISSGMAASFGVGLRTAISPYVKSKAAAKVTTWTSKDPLVGDLANLIESKYPGLIKGVNVPMRDASGKLVTDADIMLQNAVIQVKSGGGTGATTQLLNTQTVTDLPVILYGPSLKGSVVKGVQKAGGLVTTDIETLLKVIAP